ncbi:MAG: glutathione peroxidase [Ilumatobacteraceae bacterium]|nr:glutathione peroxidase [Ilumatobacteraceae bacterium]
MTSIYDFSATSINGQEKQLSEYQGKALLVVNTASKCGFTPQYKGLEQLYEDYSDKGLVVLGFPCDQFGHQEPGSESDIEEFCQLNYGVKFPMFAKIEVNGDNAHPLYKWLRSVKKGLLGSRIKWNFTKFLVDRNGNVLKRYSSTTKPEKIKADIEKALAG